MNPNIAMFSKLIFVPHISPSLPSIHPRLPDNSSNSAIPIIQARIISLAL
jgi:hypothetical protein